MSKFYDLKVSRVNRETTDSVSIEFEVPAVLKSVFTYKQGQYLTFKYAKNGEELRRSYSICSSPYTNETLKVAVKMVKDGVFSTFANTALKAGDVLSTMPPAGNFYSELKDGQKKKYVAFAAGSGITPVLSIVKSVLAVEKNSSIELIYGNKDENSTIFKSEIDALKANHPQLNVTYVYSRQSCGDALCEGRIDKSKCLQLIDAKGLTSADEFFICGPEEMILNASEALKEKGVDKKKVHFELFTTPVKLGGESTATPVSDFKGKAKVTVLMYGEATNFELDAKGKNLLDASIDAGVDAPFSCKGAVCCTCKAKIIEGKASMDMNYALSEEEVNDGYILTCQAHPQSEKLTVDFDV